MKFAKSLLILIILSSIVVLNWNCQEQNIQNTGTTQNSQEKDYPPDGVSLTVYEYCYITPPSGEGDPFYQYRTVKSIAHDVSPIGYTYDNFTTPYADRYDENGWRYQTQWFKFSLLSRGVYTCITCNCAARYSITGELYKDHFYCEGSCTDCPYPGNKYCYWSEDRDQQYLDENTSYNMYAGSDCIVNDEWEIGD